jgi:hypothetical protein
MGKFEITDAITDKYKAIHLKPNPNRKHCIL